MPEIFKSNQIYKIELASVIGSFSAVNFEDHLCSCILYLASLVSVSKQSEQSNPLLIERTFQRGIIGLPSTEPDCMQGKNLGRITFKQF